MQFEVTPAPIGVGPQIWIALGRDRWVWQYYPDKFLSVSTQDATGLYTIVESQNEGPVLLANHVTSDGDLFIFHQVNLVDPTTVQGILAKSNGLEPSTPYLVPPDDSYYGSPAYAHSHIGWFRGIGQNGVNDFAAIELWASLYSADPGALVPYKVGDCDRRSIPMFVVGGYGRLAFTAHSLPDGTTPGTLVWDLAAKTVSTYVLPNGYEVYRHVGVTPEHVWVAGLADMWSPADKMVRFALQ